MNMMSQKRGSRFHSIASSPRMAQSFPSAQGTNMLTYFVRSMFEWLKTYSTVSSHVMVVLLLMRHPASVARGRRGRREGGLAVDPGRRRRHQLSERIRPELDVDFDARLVVRDLLRRVARGDEPDPADAPVGDEVRAKRVEGERLPVD